MNAQAVPAMLPVLPELVLAVGAMALLMFGVFRGERAAPVVNWAGIALLVGVAIIMALLPHGRWSGRTSNRQNDADQERERRPPALSEGPSGRFEGLMGAWTDR